MALSLPLGTHYPQGTPSPTKRIQTILAVGKGFQWTENQQIKTAQSSR